MLVLALVSPPMAAVACDLVCALTTHDAPLMTMTCHEHMAHHHDGAAMKGMASGPCHDDDDSPAAVLSDSLQAPAVPAVLASVAGLPRLDLLHLTRAALVASRSPGSPPLASQLRI